MIRFLLLVSSATTHSRQVRCLQSSRECHVCGAPTDGRGAIVYASVHRHVQKQSSLPSADSSEHPVLAARLSTSCLFSMVTPLLLMVAMVMYIIVMVMLLMM